MSRDKQIEDMAKVIEEARIKANDTTNIMNYGFGGWYAKELYNAGYRKASEVAREIFENCHNTLIKILNTARDGLDKAVREDNEEAKLIYIGSEETIKCIMLIFDEIKKKYVENKGE